MELRHMRYFIAVAEALSFTKAAAQLRLSQPSLTRQVRNLEDELGVRLLIRAHSRITLTEEGRRFLFDSKKLLGLCDDMIAAVQRLHEGDSAQLNIGYMSHLHYGLLPATLGAFRKLCPGVAINLFDMTRGEQYQALAAHKIDLGFVGLRPPATALDLLSACVAHDDIVIALPARHLIARKPRVNLAELASQFFIGLSSKTHPGSREWLLDTCQQAGFTAKILQEANSEPTVIRCVADGLGVALMPAQVSALAHEGVVFRPLSPPLRRDSTIAWRADNAARPLADYIQIVRDLSQAS